MRGKGISDDTYKDKMCIMQREMKKYREEEAHEDDVTGRE